MGYGHFRYARRVDADTFNMYTPDMVNAIQVDTGTANTTKILGQSATAKNLFLYANQTDATPYIKLDPTNGIYHAIPAAKTFIFLDGGNTLLNISKDAANTRVKYQGGGSFTNYDLYFEPDGTGYVSFGTRTATGDVACNGHLDIKDSSGNVVKLMTTA